MLGRMWKVLHLQGDFIRNFHFFGLFVIIIWFWWSKNIILQNNLLMFHEIKINDFWKILLSVQIIQFKLSFKISNQLLKLCLHFFKFSVKGEKSKSKVLTNCNSNPGLNPNLWFLSFNSDSNPNRQILINSFNVIL